MAWNSELQWNLCEMSLREAKNKLDGTEQSEKTRKTYFYDTENLDLYYNGVVIRERQTKKKIKRTVKVDVDSKKRIPDRWKNVTGFKCEFDVHSTQSSLTCSLEIEIERDSEKDKPLLSNKQIGFLKEFSTAIPLLPKVKRLGVMQNKAYDIFVRNRMVSLEANLIEKDLFMEISFRSTEKNVEKNREYFQNFLDKKGFKLCRNQGSTSLEKLKLLRPR